ncbi:MAG: 3'-5' exonuclease [Pseudomonadota bacterium]
MQSIIVFDIETIPDIENGRRLLNLADLSDDEVLQAMQTLRQQTHGSQFPPLHLHKIIALSLVLRQANHFNVWSLGDIAAPEKEIISRFFSGISKFRPMLVSWNGGGFDLPVLHYRALLHGISAPQYWETGDEDQAFRWNNYLNRYHYRHLDLMDILANYQNRAFAPLTDIATMLGFPGKIGMDGSQVLTAYRNGEIAAIRNYCETDVLNTYLIYLRFQLIRGKYDEKEYNNEIKLVKEFLAKSAKHHLQEFLEKMQPLEN